MRFIGERRRGEERLAGGRTGEEEVEEKVEGLTQRGRGNSRSGRKKCKSEFRCLPLVGLF